MKNIGVILAGGSGTRFGSDKPKQFLRVAGRKILEHTLDTFQNSQTIDEVAIVTHKGYVDEVKELINVNSFSKVKKILLGGSTRNESSLAAINAYWSPAEQNEINLIFHDAVRPFVSNKILNDINTQLNNYNAIDVAIPSTDTIIEVEDSKIVSIPDRNKLMNGQTPQAFKLSTIKRAYDLGLKDPNFKATDDCGVIRKYLPEESIFVVDGDPTNIKITHELDLFISDKIFQIRHKQFFNQPSLEGMQGKVLVVFGGNDGIGGATADLAEVNGAKVFRFSRSLTGTDITKPNDVKSALELVYKECGNIDFVVNSAAILNRQPLAQMDYETINESLDINIKGAIIVAKESYSYLCKTNGQLLNYTSSSYTRGRAFYAVYSATKTAIVNLTQALAEEWELNNVRVNCINPERTKTPMRTKNFGMEAEDTLLKAEKVAEVSLKTLLGKFSGQLIYVKRI
ncbi:bifunctional cytidylyltransferase/SDR family oxidoreductase [Saccharicrinis aurantiacus]|uniref:bifunctional cytidylyltransferase/SDR family oxidoreductase n=1 Tax=Saccharicrinis aurantiacus TaxID=1849719 RepID=UPI002490BCB6|nr:bifunctional cytidylyltransferase/SDR family oxidoreductase [Saccharicrinis aurantiacus]